MCKIAGAELSERQKYNYGYMHMLLLLKYKSTLKECNKKSDADQTWTTFKTLFRDAYMAMRKTEELRQTDGLNHSELMDVVSEGVHEAMKEAPEPQLPTQLVEQADAMLGLPTNQPDVMSQIHEMYESMNQIHQMLLASKQSNYQYMIQPQQSFKPAFQQYHQPQMMPQYGQPNSFTPCHMQQQFQPQCQQQFQPQFQQRSYHNQGQFAPNQQQNQMPNQMTSQMQNQMRARTDKYCWTHGGCGHKSKKCKHKV